MKQTSWSSKIPRMSCPRGDSSWPRSARSRITKAVLDSAAIIPSTKEVRGSSPSAWVNSATAASVPTI